MRRRPPQVLEVVATGRRPARDDETGRGRPTYTDWAAAFDGEQHLIAGFRLRRDGHGAGEVPQAGAQGAARVGVLRQAL
jgi:hypothetical protein